MIALTKKTEYAIIAACHLARCRERVVAAREIAEHYSIRVALLMNVLKQMHRGGVVESVRGARGGYRLARDAEELTLADLIESVEGPPRLVRCAPPVSGESGACDLISSCPVRLPLMKAHEHLCNYLRGVTVADLTSDADFAAQERPETATKVTIQ